MKIKSLNYIFLLLPIIAVTISCDDDDTMIDEPMAMATCDDGMMNGDETGVDCGGSCEPCEIMSMDPDFSGTYAQVDFMGRPGINSVLSANGDIKDMHNISIPSEMAALFQPSFEAQLENLHNAYALALGLTIEDVDYEPNILGDILNGPDNDGFTENPVTATVLTTVLANDVLEVAPAAPTTYFNPGVGAPTYENGIGLTGRTPQDDVIDISLILLFGGGNGTRFNGEGGLPLLVSDGVALTATISDTFPYLGDPE